MRVPPVLPAALLVGAMVLLCQPASATTSGIATGVVEYRCTTDNVLEKQDIKVNVELTMPVGTTTGQQMSIAWLGTYADGTALRAPGTGLASGTKLYAYASISKLPKLTSATGVGELETVGPGEIIPLPTASVDMRTTSANAGTATVRAAAMNFGTVPSQPSIECEVLNKASLTTYPLTISGGGQTATPTPETTSPEPTDPATPAEDSANEDGTVREIPSGGAETGGGGTAGPDGQALVLTGLLLVLAAVAGLLLSRRSLAA